MAERHDALMTLLRRRLGRQGFLQRKRPTPTFIPDYFGERYDRNGKLLEQILVEAEIETTLFKDHTAGQLIEMDDYMRHAKRRRIKVRGILLLPRKRSMKVQGSQLLTSLFAQGTAIELMLI